MAIVLNATHVAKGHGYSYGYEYGVLDKKKPWYKKHIINKDA